MKPHLFIVILALWLGGAVCPASAAPSDKRSLPVEADYYRIINIPIPDDIVLEPGGLEIMPDGKLAVSSRRGDIYMLSNAFEDNADNMRFDIWASGLHEVLGLAYRDGWLYATQRGEVTRIRDINGDGRADQFRTFCDDWGISGDYHEYAFGSKFDPEGNMWMVLCLTGSFSSQVPYRGWCVRLSPEGKLIPTASGIRSPGGIGMNCEGEVFYCDNQGPWNGTSALKHLVPGSFQGHPAGLSWHELPEVKAVLGEKPDEPRDKSRFHIEHERLPHYIPPPILLPHGKLGQSASGIVCDNTKGKFGPFAGQLFVSDQTFSVINRVYLEKVNGLYQGMAIPFRKGFGSGNVPMLMCPDGSIYVGGTARGWGSRGRKPYALDRLVWTGKTPFEILRMHSQPDGFELVFTEPVDPGSASDPASYDLKTYTYIFQSSYGSPEVDHTQPKIGAITVSNDGRRVRLKVDGLQIGHVHELKLEGVRNAAEDQPLLHDTAYYTLWNIAERPL